MAEPILRTGIIYCGDCLDVMKDIKDFPDESVDLIYLDPPFFSQKNYENFWIKDKASKTGFSDKDWEKLKSKVNPAVLKDVQRQISPSIAKEENGIEQRWKGGHAGFDVYIAYMRERLEQCKRVLKPTGSIYLHCDHHASHYLKVMMDGVFSYQNFRNEIVWKRTNHPKGSQFKAKKFGVCTDSIFWYTKSDYYPFNLKEIKKKLSNEELEKKYPKRDDKGRYYVGPIIRSSSMGSRPNLVYEYKGYTPQHFGWRMQKNKLIELDKKGDLGWTSERTPFRKLRIEDDEGEPMYNLFDDIDRVGSGEKLGYPTQKPEALLDRIIKASSNEGDVVLDLFCGCGTTLSVAKKLKRNFIGIDVSRTACDVVRSRVGEGIPIIGGETEEELRKMDPHTFERFIIVEKMRGIVGKKTGDMGVDGWIEMMTVPVQVKRWGHKVGRPEIDKFLTAITRQHKSKGMIVGFEFSKDCVNEVARIKSDHKVDIELKLVSDIVRYE